ncbi:MULTISPECIES: helix-turn-helix domain-containing protein [Pseudomonas aeruginosa group]|uniref:helix-turn-helix domain-containing protein n=1 Tax=Pseudomonas TaxID=286 RepID=UPI0004F2EA5A|nr:helix-turn-helix transcriptional regulator [Pseudomonas aeruginosa]NMZ60988.1 helix-turn-helix transcriptional regulator [Pseudomonas nitroreducens]SNT47348.1 Helix-turn-helix [Pseudomonas nitroreducens]HCE7942330.1 helix-turn-helix transcriptional regulator [Pseudomonas aeruginosa]HCF0264810.1 helix-turn-helix transcriptional regulator [Pseudomonas aeruginosa]
MELKVAFARCLKELRCQRHLAQVDLGHQAHISRLESGKQEATLTTIEQVAEALGMTSIELLTRAVALQSGQDPVLLLRAIASDMKRKESKID